MPLRVSSLRTGVIGTNRLAVPPSGRAGGTMRRIVPLYEPYQSSLPTNSRSVTPPSPEANVVADHDPHTFDNVKIFWQM